MKSEQQIPKRRACSEPLERRVLLSTTYWVDAAAGNNAFPGTADQPLQTITKAVSLAKAGDTVDVRGGTYRGEKIVFPASGTASSPITLTAAPGADVEVLGSEVVQGWTLTGGASPIYTHSNWGFYFGTWNSAFTTTPQGATSGLDARSMARNQLFVDGVYVQEVPRQADLAPGTFYVDKTAKTLSVWLADGSDPTQHAVEGADTSGPLLTTNSQSNLVVGGLHFLYGANAAQGFAMVQVPGGSNVTVQDITVQYAAGAGIDLSNASNITVLRSTFNHNGQLGIHSSGLTDSLVKDCDNSYNDQLTGKVYSPGFEAGGDKFSRSRRVVVDGMLAHNNFGSGIWFDIDNQNATITNSVSYENSIGIFYEISYTATITNNVTYNNRLQGNAVSSPNGIGIYLSSSAGCKVYNNTSYGNDTYGVLIGNTIRDDGSGRQISGYSNDLRNNIVAQNEVQLNNTKSYAISYFEDGTHPALPTLVNPNPDVPEDYNRSDYNLFWLSPSGPPFFIGSGSSRPNTLAGWQQNSTQDLHSVWADPKFVNAAAADFRLTASSPAKLIGTALAETSTDHVGVPRFAGAYDAGAYQLSAKATVTGRRVFYNHSYWNDPANGFTDDNAIDASKSALLPGGTATFANYTGSSLGLNGVMIDVPGLPSGTALSAADFTFKVGNSADPGSWATAPAPVTLLVRRGAGAGGSDRVEVVWADGAVKNQWLQVTMLSNADTGLIAPDVFYFGNAVGETGNAASDAIVDATDFTVVGNHPADFLHRAAATSAYDFNHDSFVDATDLIIARDGATTPATVLQLIAPAAAAVATRTSAIATVASPAAAPLALTAAPVATALVPAPSASVESVVNAVAAAASPVATPLVAMKAPAPQLPLKLPAPVLKPPLANAPAKKPPLATKVPKGLAPVARQATPGTSPTAQPRATAVKQVVAAKDASLRASNEKASAVGGRTVRSAARAVLLLPRIRGFET